MRHVRSIAAALAVLAFAVPAFGADAPKTNPDWERMKSLVGTWQGKEGGTTPVTVTYKLVSNGSALMETMAVTGETEMITMYHPDGNAIMATHYCAAGNQPRMRAAASQSPTSIAFRFVDATNVQDPNGEMMRGLVVTFADADHFKQEWTSRSQGKEQTGVIEYTRQK